MRGPCRECWTETTEFWSRNVVQSVRDIEEASLASPFPIPPPQLKSKVLDRDGIETETGVVRWASGGVVYMMGGRKLGRDADVATAGRIDR